MGLPCAERCAKAALNGQGRRRRSGFCSSLVKSSFIEDLQDSDDSSTASDSALSPEARHAMLRTSGASFAWHGSRWLVGSFRDCLPQKARFVAAIFSWQFWREQIGRAMRCGDYCLHACMNSRFSHADNMAYKVMETRASALLLCRDLGREDLWDPMRTTATILEDAQVRGGPNVGTAVNGCSYAFFHGPRDSPAVHGHVQLGMHTPSAAFLGHDGTCVSSTQWGKRFKVLKQRRPTRRHRRRRRAWLACDMYGAHFYLLMMCMLAVRVMSGQCSPWQWLPGACKTSQSGPKSGHRSPVDFSVCLHGFESGKSMAMEGTVVDARVAAFPIRVAGASAKLDGQQGTQRSATCLGKWQFRCCATCRSSVSCTCRIFQRTWKTFLQQYFSWNWLHRFTVYALSLRAFASAVDDEFQSHPAVEHVKSVRHGTFPLWIAWLLVLFLSVPGTWAHPSHGMPDAEVRTTYLPTISTFHAPTCSKPGKRAYHRACKRAFLQGGTMYRGRWHTEATLNARRVTGSCSPRAKPRAPAAKSRHLRVLTWNIGGMGGGVYDSFLEFASTLNYDIILLQETKMQFTNTWTDAKWHFIHSGAKHAGVLIMISRAITSQNSIRFQCLEEGRLLEARFALHDRQDCMFTIFNLYQHAWHDTAGVISKRHHLWTTLSKAVGNTPVRHRLIVAGDFNAPCITKAGLCGAGVLRQEDHQATDVNDLSDIMVTHDLCACNTWRTDVPAHTFKFGALKSQLDFIMVRRTHASIWSRQSRSLQGFPVGRWRSGALHYPVLAEIPCTWRIWSRNVSKSCPSVDVPALLQASQDSEDGRILELKQTVRQEVARHSTMEQMDQALTAKLHALFPLQRRTAVNVWQDSLLQQHSAQAWKHFHLVRAQSQTLGGLVKAWKHWTMFQKWQKQYTQRGKAVRRERRLQLLREAQVAADRHDQWKLYQIVRRLAPRQRLCKLQLREGGCLLSPVEEMKVVHRHFQELFNPGQGSELPERSLESSIPVNDLEVLAYLEHIPMRKAVSKTAAPGCVYRICAQELCQWLGRRLRQVWSRGPITLPRCWKTADLILINKPGTSGHDIKHWRPIGLQHPLSKCILNMLLDEVRPYISELVTHIPQFAYHTGRSTEDALQRVFYHCHLVRSLCRDSQANVHTRYAGTATTQLVGGLQVCLDLSSAFDRVPWEQLDAALVLAGLPDHLRHRLMHWLEDSEYCIHVSSQTRIVKLGRGVKQGCRTSPILFSAYTALICRRIDEKLGGGWSARHLTIYADDFHVGFVVHGLVQLKQRLRETRTVMRVIEEMGMTLNPSKAAAIVTFRGSQRAQATAHCLLNKGKHRLLGVGTGRERIFIPVTQTTKYLGAQISYGDFETATLKHRLQQGRVRYWQLVSILNSKQSMTLQHRIALWKCVIWPTLSYGLGGSGLSTANLKTLQSTVMKQLRAIAGSQSHVTRESDRTLLDRLDVQSPCDALRNHVTKTGRHGADSFVFSWEHAWKVHLRDCFDGAKHGLDAVPTAVSATACPTCGLYFSDARAMKVHWNRKHAATQTILEVASTIIQAQPLLRCALRSHGYSR